MEKVIKSVQTVGLSGMKKSKINEIKIMGMSLPVYIIAAFVILYAAMTGILPENMVGALAIMMVLGSALNLMGNKIPIIRSYLGGGAVFCIFASSALATFGILPSAVVENCKDFMNNVGFLDFYIAALITGSILGMNRDLLKKAAVRFLPISFLSMVCVIRRNHSSKIRRSSRTVEPVRYEELHKCITGRNRNRIIRPESLRSSINTRIYADHSSYHLNRSIMRRIIWKIRRILSSRSSNHSWLMHKQYGWNWKYRSIIRF